MRTSPRDAGAANRSRSRDLVIVQVLLDLKNSDPTALTAAEAIQHLLGFGDRLAEIRRRSLHEWVLRAREGHEGRAALPGTLSAYLDRTVVFWNSNKQRAWVRFDPAGSSGAPWEVQPAAQRKPGDFGRPDLSRPDYDHLLVWPRGRGDVPTDLLPMLSGWDLEAANQGELWSLRWREGATAEERGAWTRAVGAARSRREGLLCNPHAQDHRVLCGAVPLPLWSGAAAESAGESEAGKSA